MAATSVLGLLNTLRLHHYKESTRVIIIFKKAATVWVLSWIINIILKYYIPLLSMFGRDIPSLYQGASQQLDDAELSMYMHAVFVLIILHAW